MQKPNLRNHMKELLQPASPYRDRQHNRNVCRQFYEALAAARPDEQLRAWRHRRVWNRYAYLDILAELKVAIMRDDWYLICAALQDMVHFYPVTFAPIRETVLAALEEKLREETPTA